MGGYPFLSTVVYARNYKDYFHGFLGRLKKFGENFALLTDILSIFEWSSGNIAVIYKGGFGKNGLYRGISLPSVTK